MVRPRLSAPLRMGDGRKRPAHPAVEDIEEKAEGVLSGGAPYPHYIGAIIVAEPSNQPFGTVRERLLVDGHSA